MNQEPLRFRFIELAESQDDSLSARPNGDALEASPQRSSGSWLKSQQANNAGATSHSLLSTSWEFAFLFVAGVLLSFAMWGFLPRNATIEVQDRIPEMEKRSQAELALSSSNATFKSKNTGDMPNLQEKLGMVQLASFEDLNAKSPRVVRGRAKSYQVLESEGLEAAYGSYDEIALLQALKIEGEREPAMIELQHRGWKPSQLAVAMDLICSPTQRRLQVMDDLLLDSQFNAGPWLRFLATDSDEVVKTRALQLLHQNSNPSSIEVARDAR